MEVKVDTETPRHIMRVPITVQAMINLLETGRKFEVEQGIPEGAVVSGLNQDPYNGVINMFIEHGSFPECKPQDIPEVFEVKLRQINPETKDEGDGA